MMLGDPLQRLSALADRFISQDTEKTSIKDLLQECIDTLANYRDECKKIKSQKDHLSKDELYHIYETAYLYYKIVHTIVSSRIPHSPDFEILKNNKNASKEQQELFEIYNLLAKSLLNDDKIVHIKEYLRQAQNQPYDKRVENANDELTNDGKLFQMPSSGSSISSKQLNHLLQMYEKTVLLIDVRSRSEFEKQHIKARSVICIEPISFKKTYTDMEVGKKSLITSPTKEIELFHRRNTFDFIVLYTKVDDKNIFYLQQQEALLDILMNRSFAKPLGEGKGSRIFVLDKGISHWIVKGGKTESSVIKQNGDNIYTTGSTNGLSLQSLPQLSPSISNSMDQSMKAMMYPNLGSDDNNNNSGSNMIFPQQQQPSLQRTPSLKSIFSKTRSELTSPTSSPFSLSLADIQRPATPTDSLNSSTSNSKIVNSNSTNGISSNASVFYRHAGYPEKPTLLSKRDGFTNKNLMQISPINSRVLTSLSKNDLVHVSHPLLSRQNSSNSSSQLNIQNGNYSMDNGLKSSSGPTLIPLQVSRDLNSPKQPPPRLPQIPNQNSTSYASSTTPKYDLDFTVGLENMGNSCYMNCIIQCFLSTHELTQMFLNNSYEKHINLNSKLGSKGILARYFGRLIHTMYRHGTIKNSAGKTEPVKPAQFKMACGSINSLFKDRCQQDCQEFCQFLLDGLHEDLNQCGGNPPLKELSPDAEKMREKLSLRIASSIEWERFLTTDFSFIVDLFQGQYASQLKCKVCGCTSTTYQTFSVFSVPVPKTKSCTLIDCFNEFTKIESLDVDELWSCPDCKKKQPSVKKLTITRLPRTLIIHLKRFDNMMNKNNVFVNYPHVLDLTPFWANDFDGRLPPGVTDELPARGQVPPFKYKLTAVASHYGSLYGGHYTSFVDKGLKRGWYYFDDTNYRPVKNDSECITSNAYVLFYRRVYGV